MPAKKIFFLIIVFVFTACSACRSFGQDYFTKNGRISFFSKAPLENISADNNQVLSTLNLQTGIIRFNVLIKAFHFPKAMMEQHFNSDYLESDKYPSSTFKGTVTDISKVDVTRNGDYEVSVTGTLQIHGVANDITAPGTIRISDGKVSATSVFKILLKDYHIRIPSIVINNISEQIEIKVSCQYEKR